MVSVTRNPLVRPAGDAAPGSGDDGDYDYYDSGKLEDGGDYDYYDTREVGDDYAIYGAEDYNELEDLYEAVRCLYVEPSRITLGAELGTGAFGIVCKGELRPPTGKPVVVAVKTLNAEGAADATMQQEFLKEANIVMELAHPNIVRILATTTSQPWMIAMEFMPYGSLLSYLINGVPRDAGKPGKGKKQPAAKKASNAYEDMDEDAYTPAGPDEDVYERPHPDEITAEDMMRWSRQCVEGIGYLAENRIVHRDVRVVPFPCSLPACFFTRVCFVHASMRLTLPCFRVSTHHSLVCTRAGVCGRWCRLLRATCWWPPVTVSRFRTLASHVLWLKRRTITRAVVASSPSVGWPWKGSLNPPPP